MFLQIEIFLTRNIFETSKTSERNLKMETRPHFCNHYSINSSRSGFKYVKWISWNLTVRVVRRWKEIFENLFSQVLMSSRQLQNRSLNVEVGPQRGCEMYKNKNARDDAFKLFSFFFLFLMTKDANLRRLCRCLCGVINLKAPNWFITTLRELINYKKLLIAW